MKRILILSLAALTLGACCNNAPQDAPKGALETIMSRKSVRSYTDQPISEAQVETLLKAAMAAPTGMNLQPWRFVVVTDSTVKEKLAGPRGGMVKNAPLVVVVCGETGFIGRDGELRENGNWTADCAAATQNLLLAAEAIGLGAVWTACYPYEERMAQTIEVLGIPEGTLPYCIVPVGYPAGDDQPKDKWKPEKIHYNAW